MPYSFRATKLNGKQWTEYLLRCSCLSFAPLPPTKVSFISIWVQTIQKYVFIYLLSPLGALLLYKVLKSFNADDVPKVDWDRLIISINATVTVKCSRTCQEIWMVERCGGKYIYFILCVSEERGDTGQRAKGSCGKGGTNHLQMEKCGGGGKVLRLRSFKEALEWRDAGNWQFKLLLKRNGNVNVDIIRNLQGAEETETFRIF